MTASRSRVLSLLSEACELEHALACSYLYAAFSIKREIDEGITWEQQQRNRIWASQIYMVAAQEMLHLAQAWNLLAAVGGTPTYARPNYPLPARWYPLKVALVLRKFDVTTLERFVLYETPVDELAQLADGDDLDELPTEFWPTEESRPYRSVGELYEEVRHLIGEIPEDDLFIARHRGQVGTPIIDFYDIVRVYDRESANRAIDCITLQGEGTSADRHDSHYGTFRAMRDEVAAIDDDPARPVGDNPFYKRRADQIPAPYVRAHQGGVELTELTDETAKHAVDLFDDSYVLMLQALGYVFHNAAKDTREIQPLAQLALELMVRVLKPLGEAICLMPSGTPGVNAGPTFAISRHVHLPTDATVAHVVVTERLAELGRHGELLASGMGSDDTLARELAGSAGSNLRALAARMAAEPVDR